MESRKNLKRIIVIAAIATVSTVVAAQVTTIAFQKRIVINASEVQIDSLLKILSRQTGIGFSFNSTKISPTTKIVGFKQSSTLSQWLIFLNQKLGVQHKIVSNHVILVTSTAVVDNRKIHRLLKNDRKVPVLKAKAPTSFASSKKQFTNAGTPSRGIKRLNSQKATSVSNKIRTASSGHNSKIEANQSNAAGELGKTVGVGGSNPTDIKDTLYNSHLPKVIDASVSNQSGILKADSTLLTKAPVIEPAIPFSPKKDTREPAPVLPLKTIDFGPEGLAISYDIKVGSKIIVDWTFGLGGGYAITDSSLKYYLNIRLPEVYSSITTRYYYNRDKRLAKGKSVLMNTGDYVGLKFKYVSDYLSENRYVWDALLINVHWGMQRSISNRVSLNGYIGGGYGLTAYFKSFPTYRQFYPTVGFNFSYRISRQRE